VKKSVVWFMLRLTDRSRSLPRNSKANLAESIW